MKHQKEIFNGCLKKRLLWVCNNIYSNLWMYMKIVYIVFDSKLCLQQAYCSIISCIHFNPQKKKDIILFTDENIEWFDFPVTIKPISSLWLPSNENDHILMKRIQIIKRCMEHYDMDVLCIDADTLFFKPLWFDTIRPWFSYVHMYESPVHSYKWWTFGKVFDIKYWAYKQKIWTTDMYNASILWISKKDKDILNEVSDITDIVYKMTGEWTSDQVAFSYVLGIKTHITYLYDKVFHYRAYKKQTLEYIYNSLDWSKDADYSLKKFSLFINSFAFWCLQFIEKTWDHIIDYFMSKPEEYEKLQELMLEKKVSS